MIDYRIVTDLQDQIEMLKAQMPIPYSPETDQEALHLRMVINDLENKVFNIRAAERARIRKIVDQMVYVPNPDYDANDSGWA